VMLYGERMKSVPKRCRYASISEGRHQGDQYGKPSK
jgi:hypothetical protein